MYIIIVIIILKYTLHIIHIQDKFPTWDNSRTQAIGPNVKFELHIIQLICLTFIKLKNLVQKSANRLGYCTNGTFAYCYEILNTSCNL